MHSMKVSMMAQPGVYNDSKGTNCFWEEIVDGDLKRQRKKDSGRDSTGRILKLILKIDTRQTLDSPAKDLGASQHI